MNKKTKKLPLEGVRVLSLTASWSGPFGCMLLGDLGAEVLRLEQIQYAGGMTRGVQARPDEKIWINNYHQDCYDKLSKHLESEELEYLKDITKAINV